MRRAGWILIVDALSWVGYLVIALTLGAGYEQALIGEADAADTAVNTLPASTMAEVVQDYPLYAVVTATYLFLPPLLLLVAAATLRREVPSRATDAAWWAALGALAVWTVYDVLNLGLFADPDDLPPLVRDLDVLTVPFVTAVAVLTLAAVLLLGEGLRSVVPRAGRITSVLCVVMAGLTVWALVASDFTEPVPPIVAIPAVLVLGIALVRARPSVSS
jgi:hypothetical protein